ncbi:helix-turn-helix transcriptional regulator [Desulfitobacterium sp. THU1]|uniref:helix-turn-helix transcriptional regulator n=1 Tax=Desulfitobacterium sp. THU1 TaxID=3138072 RepID=UPI00311FE148
MEQPVEYQGKNKIRVYRLRAEIATQKELAQRTGLSQSIISDLERGRRNLSPAWAMRIGEAVGTPWETLLEDE